MRANSPKQHCLALWYPMAGVALQLSVMEEFLSSHPPRGSRADFPFSRPGRTTFVLFFKIFKELVRMLLSRNDIYGTKEFMYQRSFADVEF